MKSTIEKDLQTYQGIIVRYFTRPISEFAEDYQAFATHSRILLPV